MPNVLTDIPALLASIGLILATSSFISGLQLVRGTKGTAEGKIHRFNGYSSITLYVLLAVLGFIDSGLSAWAIIGWLSGLLLIILKLLIVKTARRKKRAFKYVSTLGGILIIMWFYLLYTHLPL